jgi:hypothetical protein
MSFDPDAIARLSPEARVEVQDFYARKFLAEREAREMDRRTPKRRAEIEPPETAGVAGPRTDASRPAWPRVWFRNDSSRPTSFPHRWPPPFRPRGAGRVPQSGPTSK